MVRFHIDCTLPFPANEFWRIRDAQSFTDFVVQDGLLKAFNVTKPVYDDDGWGTRVQHYCPARVDCPNMLRAVVGDTLFEVSDEQRWNDRERPCHLHFFITPSFLSGISRTQGELSIEPYSDAESSLSSDSAGAFSVGNDEGTDSGSADLADAADSATDPEPSDASDSSDMEVSESPTEYIDSLPEEDKSKHIVSGETRVSILTLGWFVERAIVHNLRTFYQDYPATIARFRQKLYREFAAGDQSVPVSVVIDRFLEAERELSAKAPADRDVMEKFVQAPEFMDDEFDFERVLAEADLDDELKQELLDGTYSPTAIDEHLGDLLLPS